MQTAGEALPSEHWYFQHMVEN